jgi:hypothetical protein
MGIAVFVIAMLVMIAWFHYDRYPKFWGRFWAAVFLFSPIWGLFLAEWWYGYL